MSSQGQRPRESGSPLLAVALAQHRALIHGDIACLGCGAWLPLVLLAFTAESRMVALCTDCFGEQTCLHASATIMHVPRRDSCRNTVADDTCSDNHDAWRPDHFADAS
jgi:hypothetical protein